MFSILRKTKLTRNALLNVINNNTADNRPTKKKYQKIQNNHNGFYEEDECLDNRSTINNKKSTINNQNNRKYNTNVEDNSNMEFSSDSDDDYEALTCNVCDRYFVTSKQLIMHKNKKRHFGCTTCDSLFSTLIALEYHKEEFDHWSEDDLNDVEEDIDDDVSISEEQESLI